MVELATRPTFTLPEATETQDQLQVIKAFQLACRQFLVPGVDYGTIPGTARPTLLKPGAEKIVRLLGLADEYDILTEDKNWARGFFHFVVRCRLVHLASGNGVSTGLGECNSMEARYRWRWVFRSELDRMEIEPAGLRTRQIDTRNGKAKQYRIENEDIYSQVNTILKMSKKRALVDAALSAGRLSEIFNADLEDAPAETTEDPVQAPPRPTEPKPKRPGPKQTPKSRAEQLGACTEHQQAWAPLSTGEIGHPLDDGGWCYRDEAGPSETDEAWTDLTEGAEQER